MFRNIDADCYLMIDGDDTYPAENAKEMCDIILEGKADMVIGDRLSKTIATLFKEYKPALFFNIIALICLIFSLLLGLPVLTEYLNTGLVPRFPSLIVSTILSVITLLMWITGIIY